MNIVPSRTPEPDEDLARQIIAAEFNYVAQTAFQANEDRVRAWQYFFVTFATLITALLSRQVDEDFHQQLNLTFFIIFGLLTALGLITLVQLVRLRQSWLDSVQAMNQIKERLIDEDKALAGYFRWRLHTIPPAFKLSSFGFLQAVAVALLCGLALGAAVAFGALVWSEKPVSLAISTVVGLLGAAVSLWLGYVRPLRNTSPSGPGPELRGS